jgi:hypothetical protein
LITIGSDPLTGDNDNYVLEKKVILNNSYYSVNVFNNNSLFGIVYPLKTSL